MTIKSSLAIAGLATLGDTIYHELFQLVHNIGNLSTSTETQYYFGIKFTLVFIVSLAVLNLLKSGILVRSLAISVGSAFLFGLILIQMFPYSYDITIHMAHALIIMPAALLVLKLGGE